jgi:outer membrane protein
VSCRLSSPQLPAVRAERRQIAFAAGTSEEFPEQFKELTPTQMKRTFIATAMLAVVLTISALAQTGSPTPGGAAPAASPTATSTTASGGGKVGTIDMQGAIAATNEGARDFEALNKKFEPRRTELQNLSTEIENLQKQLNTQGDKMNEEARANLVKSIETKKKNLQRSMEDAQTEYQQQGSEIAQRLVQKLAPVIEKYVKANGYGLLLDSGGQWPQGPIVMTSVQMDITKAIVDAYNAQSGVAPPASASAPRPSGTAASKPAGTTAIPATKPAPSTTKPQQ